MRQKARKQRNASRWIRFVIPVAAGGIWDAFDCAEIAAKEQITAHAKIDRLEIRRIIVKAEKQLQYTTPEGLAITPSKNITSNVIVADVRGTKVASIFAKALHDTFEQYRLSRYLKPQNMNLSFNDHSPMASLAELAEQYQPD